MYRLVESNHHVSDGILNVDCSRDFLRQVKTVVEGPPQQLIETVAAKIAKDVLYSHEAVRDIMVRVQKPHVALEGVLDTLGECL